MSSTHDSASFVAARALSGWSVFVFAPMVYDAPHARKHAMVESCARQGIESVYVEPPNSTSPYHTGHGSPTLTSGRLRLSPPDVVYTTSTGIHVLCVPKKPALGPVRIPVGRRGQERLQTRWLERFFAGYRERTSKRVLAIVTTARWEPLLRNIPLDAVVYDKTDPAATLKGWLSEAEYNRRERALIARSAVVSAASQSLLTEVQRQYPRTRTLVIENGVDCAWFDAHRDASVPELADCPRPIAGFLGTVARWVDIPLLASCARAQPNWTVAVIGPRAGGIDIAPLRTCPNVRLVDRVGYDRVPAVMQHLDVGLMPFRPGPVSDAANPVTLYEFLYLGKPVVCTPMPMLEPYADLLYMSREAFLDNLDRAAHEDDPGVRERRMTVGRDHDWNNAVMQVLHAVIPHT